MERSKVDPVDTLARDNQNSILIVALTHPQKALAFLSRRDNLPCAAITDPLQIVARLSSRLWRYSRRFPERNINTGGNDV